MRVLLMHPDRDFDPRPRPLPHERDLTQDLALETLWRAMAGGDPFVYDIARAGVLSAPRHDAGTILHRQGVLKDCLRNAAAIRELYALAVEGVEAQRKQVFGLLGSHPSGILHGSINLLEVLVRLLGELVAVAGREAGRFESRGFTELFTILRRECTPEYLSDVQKYLEELRFESGILVSAELGPGNRGANYVLRRPRDAGAGWVRRWLRRRPGAYTVHVDPRDEAGARTLSEIRLRAINGVANAVAQSAQHVLGFFQALRTELAFCLGCVNLHEWLAAAGAPTCWPEPGPAGSRELRFRELYDACLALSVGRRVVGNTLDATGRDLVVVTGANEGGKSTFLRSVGLAQLMMGSGMFVAAERYAAEPSDGVLTHYKREEDPEIGKGKLDEELSRLSDLAEALGRDALLLLNESFAATNEREGSEIARQVVAALVERRVRVVFVTHLHEFARSLFERGSVDVLFLRAERLPDGTRTFRVVPGEPLETSFADDVYREVFAGTAT